MAVSIFAVDPTAAPVDAQGNQVTYNGGSYPRDKVTYKPVPPDPANNPSMLKINGIQLPGDIAIYFNFSKKLAVTPLLDGGVQVIEKINRNAYELEFECTIRDQDDQGNYIFPQNKAYEFLTNIFVPDSVLKLENTFLNKLGIREVVMDNGNQATVRGSKNIPLRFRMYENMPGQSLIVQ